MPALGRLMVGLLLLKTIEGIIYSSSHFFKTKIKFNYKKNMEIKNITLFLIGIIVLILGFLILIFDYPQIQYFENIDLKSYNLLVEEKKGIHQRLIIEFFIGITILGIGGVVLMSSFLKRFENGIR